MKGRVSLAVVQLAAFIGCEPRAAPGVGHDDLNFTIVFFLGVTMILSVYRHRTSQRETKGMFRRSRNVPLGSCCISALGRPSSQPEECIHGRGRELFDSVERLSSHAPCASRLKALRTARPS